MDAVVGRYEKKCEAFNKWFIDQETEAVISILRQIENEFTLANSVFPSDTPAKLSEFIVRRYHMNKAIGSCYMLKQEINYVIRTLPVDINKAERFDEAINKQIKLYKGVRQADNRFLKTKKPEDSTFIHAVADAADRIMNIIDRMSKTEIK